MNNSRETAGDKRSETTALVPVSADKMLSKTAEKSLLAQDKEPGEQVTDLVLSGRIRDIVLVSPYVRGGEVGKRITSAGEIANHPYRAIFFQNPYSERDQKTFLIAVSVAYKRDEGSRQVFGFTGNVNQIERHGLFLLQFPRRNFPDASSFSQWLEAWNGLMSYNYLDRLFPDTSQFGYDFYQESRGFRKGELAFSFDSVYPPNVKPTEFIGVSFTANEQGPIKIIPVDNEERRVLADRILVLNSTVGSEIGRAGQIIAQAEKKGGEVGDEILHQVVGQHVESQTIAPEELRGIKATFDGLVEQCKTDPRRLEMLRKATLKLLRRIHPDIPGALGKYNQQVVKLITEFNEALRREIDAWEKAQRA